MGKTCGTILVVSKLNNLYCWEDSNNNKETANSGLSLRSEINEFGALLKLQNLSFENLSQGNGKKLNLNFYFRNKWARGFIQSFHSWVT